MAFLALSASGLILGAERARSWLTRSAILVEEEEGMEKRCGTFCIYFLAALLDSTSPHLGCQVIPFHSGLPTASPISTSISDLTNLSSISNNAMTSSLASANISCGILPTLASDFLCSSPSALTSMFPQTPTLFSKNTPQISGTLQKTSPSSLLQYFSLTTMPTTTCAAPLRTNGSSAGAFFFYSTQCPNIKSSCFIAVKLAAESRKVTVLPSRCSWSCPCPIQERRVPGSRARFLQQKSPPSRLEMLTHSSIQIHPILENVQSSRRSCSIKSLGYYLAPNRVVA